jgi:urea transport system substrate-binding protein
VIADTRSNDSLAAQEAERLMAAERVDVLFGCWTSACRKAVKPIVERHRNLLFYNVQYEGMEQSEHILYTGATPNQQIVPGTHWALENFGKRLFLVGSDYVFPRAANRIIRDIAGVSNGEVLAERYRPLGDNDWAAVIEEIRRLKPDVVLSTINGDSNTPFFHALREAGLANMPVFSFSLAEAELQAMGPECFHPRHYGVWGYFQSLPGEANARFVASFRTRYGASRVVSDPMVASYSALKLWANTVREVGATDQEVINLALLRQSVPGPAGIVAVDAVTRHTWRPVLIGLARNNGQYELLHASETLVRPAPFMSHRSQTEWLKLVEGINPTQ